MAIASLECPAEQEAEEEGDPTCCPLVDIAAAPPVAVAARIAAVV